jgi:hypothetical protein
VIEIIANPFYDDFMSLCAEARTSIKLCAPYVKATVMSDLLNVRRNGVVASLVTRISLQDYHSKVSDLEPLHDILKNGGLVFNCSNLHAKVYIFDDRKCIVTSANLTIAGLKRNAECGLLTDDATIVNSALEFYDEVIWGEDVGKITQRIVAEISKLLENISPMPKIKYPQIDLSNYADSNLTAISDRLSGWKKDVFLSLGQFGESFTSAEVNVMAQQLKDRYPQNNNREAKIRQVLQQLRDLGLVEFTSPGIYRKLWG